MQFVALGKNFGQKTHFYQHSCLVLRNRDLPAWLQIEHKRSTTEVMLASLANYFPELLASTAKIDSAAENSFYY